jgi:predicted ATPase
MAHSVFISYSHLDKAVADAICVDLEKAGIRCWIAPRDIAPGLDWPTAISNAIAASHIMVLVFSSHSNSSQDVGRELILASNNNLVIIPVRLEDIEPEPGKQYYLARTHWFDAADPPTRVQLDALTGVVRSFLPGQDHSITLELPPPIKIDRHNLPAQLTTFIGRTKEIAEIKTAVSENRLVSLIGPGGTGKTRLSLQAAADLCERFPEGVWFIDLASLMDPALVPKTIAVILGMREEAGRSIIEILKDYLRSKEVLLVFDNCEHLVTAVAQVIIVLLGACPNLHVLATSREALGIQGDKSFHIQPLAIPDPRSSASLEAINGCESVQLFLERARAVMPAFQLTQENAHAVAQICQRLDGIPLAIELAAARADLLSMDQIVARLDSTFHLLTGGSRTALPRQQTLQATIDWSYNLLSEPERVLFQRLTVFAGGWTLEAAEMVCAGPREDVHIDTVEILDLLNALVNKSLVMVDRPQGMEARYRMLGTIRQYAGGKFSDPGESDPVHQRHLAYFLSLARQASPQLQGPDQITWFDLMEAEHDNFRAALEWSLGGPPEFVKMGLETAIDLWWFWFMRGYSNEGGAWLEKILAAGLASIDPLMRAQALCRLGWLKFDRAVIAEVLKLARDLGPVARESLAMAYWTLGAGAWYLADYDHSRTFEEKGVELFRELGHRWGMCETLTWLGMALVKQGDLRRASEVLEESLSLARQAQDVNEIAFSLWQLGNMATVKGDYAQAQEWLMEGLSHYKKIKQAQGVIWSLSSLGKAALKQGNYARAVSHYKEALTQYWDIGNERWIAEGLEQLAYAALFEWPEQAAGLLGAANALRKSAEAPQYPYEQPDHQRSLAALQDRLDGTLFADCWAKGQAMSAKQAVSFALNETAIPTG